MSLLPYWWIECGHCHQEFHYFCEEKETTKCMACNHEITIEPIVSEVKTKRKRPMKYVERIEVTGGTFKSYGL